MAKVNATCSLCAASFGLALVLLAGVSQAQTNITVLTYNVVGLPTLLANARGEDPIAHMPIIALLLNSNDYQVVAIQEGFVHPLVDPVPVGNQGTLFYDILVEDNASPMDFQTPPADMPATDLSVSSGLLRLSSNTFTNYGRIVWDMLFGVFPNDGSDEASLKGFSFARHEVASGVFVDIYNWHADAGQDSGSTAARADNIGQLIEAINMNSAGNAVILLGDTNSRYTRTTGVFRDLTTTPGAGTTIDDPLTDVWVELVRAGSVPAQTGVDLESGCATSLADANCETVDKILYRSGSSVTLTPTSYFVRTDFTDPGDSSELSDHFPTGAVFTVPEPAAAAVVALMTVGLLARSRRR